MCRRNLQFTHKDIGSKFIVYICYLAPLNSPYGRNQTDIFGHLIAQMYLYSETERKYIFVEISMVGLAIWMTQLMV